MNESSSMKKRIILFGAGKHLKKLINEIYDYGLNVVAIVDNDVKKQGNTIIIKGKENIIHSPQSVDFLDVDMVIISLYSLLYQYEVWLQLRSLGLPAEKIFTWGNGLPVPYPEVHGVLPIKENGYLFFDVSNISQIDVGTGIQRVANNLYKHLVFDRDNLIPIRWFGEIITSKTYHSNIFGSKPEFSEQRIKLTSNDKILLVDLSLLLIDKFLNITSKCGAMSYTIIYDLLPLSLPDAFESRMKDDFSAWLHIVLQHSNHVICISRTVADEVIQYYHSLSCKRNAPINVHYFHLGFDIPAESGDIRQEIKDFVARVKTFLMVGTIEPRKNHVLAIRALQRLWHEPLMENIQLLILGHDGWKNDDFKNLIQEQDVKNHILWVKDASDAELAFAYQNVTALLYPSQNEGFGLPIVEAAYHHLPIICSDIPIFHELTDGNATYFKVNDVASMKEAILAWLSEEKHPASENIRLYSWKDSAEEIMDILSGKVKPYYVINS